MVDVTFTVADDQDTRHSLAVAAPWLDDETRVLQVGWLTADEDVDEVDPYENRIVRGEAIKKNGVVYLTGFRHNTSDTMYVKIARPAYTYCRATSGGAFGDLTAGLTTEASEAVPQAEWVARGVKMLAYEGATETFWPGNSKLAEAEVAKAASGFWSMARQLAPRPAKTFVRLRKWGQSPGGFLV
jgi:hypothetical protein